MKPLQPGMLCLIIGATYCPENIGKVVRLCFSLQPGEIFPHPDTNRSIKYIGNSAGWFCQADDLFYLMNGIYGKANFCACNENHLMPIEGDEDQFSKETAKDFETIFVPSV
jgi:hypothetical protein